MSDPGTWYVVPLAAGQSSLPAVSAGGDAVGVVGVEEPDSVGVADGVGPSAEVGTPGDAEELRGGERAY